MALHRAVVNSICDSPFCLILSVLFIFYSYIIPDSLTKILVKSDKILKKYTRGRLMEISTELLLKILDMVMGLIRKMLAEGMFA